MAKPIRAICNRVNGGVNQYTLEEIKDYTDYYPLLGEDVRAFDVVMVWYKGHRLSVFVDDEGMLKPNIYGRDIEGYPQPIFGNAVIVGDVDSEGNTMDLPVELGLLDMLDFSSEIKYITKG